MELLHSFQMFSWFSVFLALSSHSLPQKTNTADFLFYQNIVLDSCKLTTMLNTEAQ